jgi:hypothetical protein
MCVNENSIKKKNNNNNNKPRVVLIITKMLCSTVVGGSHALLNVVPGNLTILFANASTSDCQQCKMTLVMMTEREEVNIIFLEVKVHNNEFLIVLRKNYVR